MLEVVRENIDQLEFERLCAPVLTNNRWTLLTFLSDAVDGMEDGDTGKVCVANRTSVIVEVVEYRIDNDLEVSCECFHAY